MILVDANLLLYARVRTFSQHASAHAWLDARLSGTARVGLPWPSLLAFLRIVTNPRAFERPESMTSAWKQVQAWLDVGVVWVPSPTPSHRSVLDELLATPGTQGNLVPDAHLAALAIEHGLTLCSTDADFARFRGLRWENPLAS